MEAGHYAGATSKGEPVSFDVTEGGDVTNVIASLDGAVISISQRFKVDGWGRWGGEVSGRGVNTRVRGRLRRSEAHGTLEAELVNGRTHHLAGPISWRARRVTGLAY
ncbi:MAG TPA: hypothetical protein VFR32_03145 [Gaiellaceae bacterium]|nr:hypothetical protein [Gaiellaceae bacterium]